MTTIEELQSRVAQLEALLGSGLATLPGGIRVAGEVSGSVPFLYLLDTLTDPASGVATPHPSGRILRTPGGYSASYDASTGLLSIVPPAPGIYSYRITFSGTHSQTYTLSRWTLSPNLGVASGLDASGRRSSFVPAQGIEAEDSDVNTTLELVYEVLKAGDDIGVKFLGTVTYTTAGHNLAASILVRRW